MSRLCRLKSYKNIGDDGKWAYAEIMRLRQQLADDRDLLIRIESELSSVKYAGHYDAGIRAIKQQLAESQAREARLRDALQFLNARIITTDLGGVVEKALALPHDDTALREYRDAVIEECAVIAGNACLVQPDGGTPTVEEVAVSEEAARRIRNQKSTSVPAGYTEEELERDNPYNQWMHE